MPNLQGIRRRIVTVKSTQKLTRAMKMVAAAKLRRAQEELMEARPYAYHIRDLTQQLLTGADRESHPLLHPGQSETIRVIVMTADRGLCGSFNATIVNEMMRLLRETFADKAVELTVVGRKGVDIFRRRPCTVRSTHSGIFDKLNVGTSDKIADEAIESFTSGAAGTVYCLYNEYKSAVSQRVTLERLLPYEPGEGGAAQEVDYIFEPSRQDVLFTLLVENIHAQMYRILHESLASEYGARMAAMDSATKNAGEVIAALLLKYNRARQEAITNAVVEVIGAAEAL